ncbi:DUF349 domain-containing protein [Demequina sp. B12]|uniref:DUF349 domain-containing protein n=1 Tax=Demequina sp. B12 TaxID=2992757 RepID=UPI00237A7666|nr:DUF349 domain-containing protein [Demequina sp. B12]MDE0573029.1 DUF349 domain-containing protein [Demequina sp. B12]
MTAPKPTPKPTPKPKPPASGATPAVLAAKPTHPVKVPVVAEVSDDQIAAAAKFGEVVDTTVVVIVGSDKLEVGPAAGDTPLEPYAKAFYELEASVERFHARLSGAELSPKDIDESLETIEAQLTEPKVVGDIAALRERFTTVKAEATEARERIKAERDAARAEALAAREQIVLAAEAIASKDEHDIHWKNDTAELRSLLDTWKDAQRSQARIPKDTERALWKRFTAARSGFEKARKHHFAQLDKDNAQVAGRKEDLVAQAERLAESTDWDRTARAFKDLMSDWKRAGRGRRSVDDALWKRFQTAQDAFFEARRSAADAEDEALAGNVEAKEAAVVEAESLLPIKDLEATKRALRTVQDKFEEAGRVPRADVARLNKRMGAVEKAIRDAEDAKWNNSNPELEARASGAVAQLEAAIVDLEKDLADAEASKDKRKIKSAQDALDARRAWLEQIKGVVS